jgi:O-antigen/teichoic acid export membrane protein
MSIKRNTIANFSGQLYKAVMGIVMLPIYFQFLGEESYGLLAFHGMIGAWLSLLTASVAPTLARQVAFARGRAELGGARFREMVRSFELILLTTGLVILALIWSGSEWLATQWLSVESIDISDVAYCIALMGVMVGLAPGVSYYSSGLSGLERQVWLSVFNIGFSTIRFAGAYVLLRWVTQDVVSYFQYQLVLGVIELIVIAWKFYDFQPTDARRNDPGFKFSWSAIKPVLPFTAGIAYTAMLWVLMTQSHKLILSHLLPLSEFGYFAMVVLLANGVLLLSGPINRAILPRLTMFYSQGSRVELLKLYRTTTQFLAAIVFPVSGMLAFFAQPVIYVVTGNESAAAWGAPLLTWFAMGNAILVIAGMQYNLQFAHGNVRMHVVNTTINAALQVPILAYVAFNYGALTVAQTWFVIRLITFFVWPPIVHHKFAPGTHWKWMTSCVFLPLLGSMLGLLVVSYLLECSGLMTDYNSRWQIASILMVAGLCVLFVCAIVSSEVRNTAFRLVFHSSK